MKRLLLILGTVLLVIGGLVAPAFAQDEGVVDVTATPTLASMFVTPSAVSYGTVPPCATDLQLVEPGPDRTIAAINNGTCWVEFLIKGADTTDWTLGPVAGFDLETEEEIYAHKFGWPGPPGPYTPLSYDYQDLFAGVSSYEPFCSQAFKLRMDTPCPVTTFGEQATTVTVMAVEVEKGISADLAIDASSYPQGTPTATLTMTVINEMGAPLTGLPSNAFLTLLKPTGGVFTAVPVTFTEKPPTGSGIYGGFLDISGLAPGTYDVLVEVRDTISPPARKASGMQSFEITAP